MSAYIYHSSHTIAEVIEGALALGWTVAVDGHHRELVAPDGTGWRCIGAAQQFAALRAGGVVPGGDRRSALDAADAELAYRMHRAAVKSSVVVAESFAAEDEHIPDGVLSPEGHAQRFGGAA